MAVVMMMATVVARAAWAAPIEARTATVPTTAIGTSTAIAAAATTAERPLEAGTRVAADAGGVTRKIFAALGTGCARTTRFPGQEDSVIFDGGRFRDGLSRGRAN